MSEFKENWRKYYPPMIPIYFMDYDALKDMLEKNPMAVDDRGLELMMGYFEEFEKYEKAALVRDAQWKRQMFAGEQHPSRSPQHLNQKGQPNFPPPNDGHKWELSEDGTHWVRQATPEENRKYLGNQNNVNKDGQNDNQTPGDNPFHG